jgi:microcystin degradation protein MlrC
VGAFAHETNTFVEEQATREDFVAYREFLGEDVVPNMSGTETQVGGVIAAADEHDIELIHTVAAFAMPAGIVEADTYEFYCQTIIDGVREHQAKLDGILLPLHGAMVAEGVSDAEGELVERVQDIVGDDVPIVVTLDLHANASEHMVELADAVLAYETYPHLDKAETGRRGLDILRRIIEGEVDPVTSIVRPPMIVFQPKAYTKEGPFAEIMAEARELERRDGILKVSVLPGFYHADIPEMGVSVVVADDDQQLADSVANEMASTLWERREEFVEDYPKPEEAVAEAKRVAASKPDDAGPVVMADFGSNPGGGGASDGTTILRQFLEQEVENAGWAILHDPEAVDTCVSAGVRERVTETIGGKTDDRHGEPIKDVEGYVKAITDGRYVNTGTSHMGAGVQNDLGRTVLFQCGKDDSVNVVLAEYRSSAFDAEVWRHVGIQPERLDVICIPSLIAFLGDYGPLSSEIILVDTPGVSAVNPEQFEYQNIPRPIYPLDDPQWAPDG